jgi:hypothetical protein
MSVALHEVTHFVSLDNTLGHLLGVFALQTGIAREALLNGSDIDCKQVDYYHALRWRYALLLEGWRPLLEGLALFVQTHPADESSDALLEPLSLLWLWKLSIVALGDRSVSAAGALQHPERDFLAAIYRAIREGPRLPLGLRSLGASLELLEPKSLLPYFLGHTYLRTLQRRLVRAEPAYEAAEEFVALILRVLRSCTRRLLQGRPRWDQPSAAERIYNWIEIASQAPADRIAALRKQDDCVDVLKFLTTGIAAAGYRRTDAEIAEDLRELVPEEWDSLEKILSATPFDRIAAEHGDPPPEMGADRLVRGWLVGTATLNLSTGGQCKVSGWIREGFGERHAVGLDVDGQLWWLAATDSDVAMLVTTPADLPRFEKSALVATTARDTLPSAPPIEVDCFLTSVAMRGEVNILGEATLYPRLRFELRTPWGRDQSVLASISPAQPGRMPVHLETVAVTDEPSFHRNSIELRRMVSRAVCPQVLATRFERRGKHAIAASLRASAQKETLAVSRVQAHANRRMLRGVLGRPPGPDDLMLLERGVGMFAEAAAASPLIAAAYGAWAMPDKGAIRLIRSLNEEANAIIGKRVFEWDSKRQRVRYCGLWGDADYPKAHI